MLKSQQHNIACITKTSCYVQYNEIYWDNIRQKEHDDKRLYVRLLAYEKVKNTNGVRLDCESPDFLFLGGGRMRRISDILRPTWFVYGYKKSRESRKSCWESRGSELIAKTLWSTTYKFVSHLAWSPCKIWLFSHSLYRERACGKSQFFVGAGDAGAQALGTRACLMPQKHANPHCVIIRAFNRKNFIND